MELSILEIIFYFCMNCASYLSVQVSRWEKLRRNYSLYHCLVKLHIGINC